MTAGSYGGAEAVRRGESAVHARFVEVPATADEPYRSRPEAWTPESEQVQAITRAVGGEAEAGGALPLLDGASRHFRSGWRFLGGFDVLLTETGEPFPACGFGCRPALPELGKEKDNA